jgi:hypothetical protein
MSRLDGAHTHGPQGGGLVMAVIAAAILLGSGAASAVASALVTIAVVLGCVIGLAVLGGIGWLVYRVRSGPVRSDRPGRPVAARQVSQLPPEVRPVWRNPPNRRSARAASSIFT